MSTFHLFSAGCAGVHTGFAIGFRAQLTLARQSETVRSTTGLGGRHDADQDSGNIAGFGRRFFVARSRNPGANRAAGDADGAGVAALGDRGIRAAPYQAAADAPARLSALRTGTRRRLSPVLSRPQCGAGLQRNLRAGIPAERHGDRASHELLLAPRLVWPLLGADQPGADHQRRRSIDDNSHRQLGKRQRCPDRSPPGPCDAKAAVAHSKPAAVDVVAKAKRDIAWLMRDDAMTISRDESCQRAKMLSRGAGTGSRDAHSSIWRSYSFHIHVAHFSLRSALRRGG